jgi:Family of unknown function (DUF6084)
VNGVPVAAPPALAFRVTAAAPADSTAAPTLSFALEIEASGAVRSLMLDAQVRIAVRRRTYDAATRERLREVLGDMHPGAHAPASLLWTRATLLVAAFSERTSAELIVPCTYDFEVASAKYLMALDGGSIPLDLLFAGTIFYGDGALQAARIPWECEASFKLPVETWQAAMDRFFPGRAWLRVRRESLDRLAAYKRAHAHLTWDEALDALLEGHER